MTKQETEYEVQLDDRKRRVKVHAIDGPTVGRFNVRAGFAIHNTVWDQLTGAAECLHLTHQVPNAADWAEFRARPSQLWGVDIPADAIDVSLMVSD